MSLPPGVLLRCFHHETSLLPRMGSVYSSAPASYTDLHWTSVFLWGHQKKAHVCWKQDSNSSLQFSGLPVHF